MGWSFFVISGFVLALPFLKHAHGMGKKVSLRSYFLRRLTRLEPPYIFSMLLFFAVMPHVGKGNYEELLPHLLASLAYVHEWVCRVGSFINNNAWSLGIEVQFYSLVPLLLGLGWKHHTLRRVVLVAFLVCGSLHSLWLPAGFPRRLLAYFQFFAIGILLCEHWLLVWHDAPRDTLWDAAGVLAALGFFAVTLAAPLLVSSVANPWLMGLFTAAVLRGRLLSRALTWGWIPIIGGMCYTIYLFHARVISLGMQTLFRRLELTGSFTLDYFILAVAIVPAIFGVSALFYAAIERPCMSHEWPRKLRQWLAQRRLVRAMLKE